jgi:hypothetical protein
VRSKSAGPEETGRERVSFLWALASLVSDSWAEPWAGERRDSEVRHLYLSAGRFDLHVRMTYADASPSIRGSLLDRIGPGPDPFDVVVVDTSGREIAFDRADEFGDFSFRRVPAEGRRVVIKLPSGRQIAWSIPAVPAGS